MRRRRFLLGAAVAMAPAARVLAKDATLTAELGPRADAQTEMEAWIQSRVTAAQRGVVETVRIPLVRVSRGWGCPCPDYYVGANPHEHDNTETWVEIRTGTERLPRHPAAGDVLAVEGRFTGEVRHSDYGLGYTYALSAFEVTRVVRPIRGRARRRFRAGVLR